MEGPMPPAAALVDDKKARADPCGSLTFSAASTATTVASPHIFSMNASDPKAPTQLMTPVAPDSWSPEQAVPYRIVIHGREK